MLPDQLLLLGEHWNKTLLFPVLQQHPCCSISSASCGMGWGNPAQSWVSSAESSPAEHTSRDVAFSCTFSCSLLLVGEGCSIRKTAMLGFLPPPCRILFAFARCVPVPCSPAVLLVAGSSSQALGRSLWYWAMSVDGLKHKGIVLGNDRCSFDPQGLWAWWSLEVPSNPYNSVILWLQLSTGSVLTFLADSLCW